jgi:hypothetical protein
LLIWAVMAVLMKRPPRRTALDRTVCYPAFADSVDVSGSLLD